MNEVIRGDIDRILNTQLIDWEAFRGKTIMVTGANGMIPAYFVYTFHEFNRRQKSEEDKVHIVALVRNRAKAEGVFGEILDDRYVELLVQDVSQPIDYTGDIHYIIHAASQASPKYYGVDPVGTIYANVFGTVNTLKLCRPGVTKGYLFISSGDVYGIVSPDKFPFNESDYGYIDLLNVRSCYGESKRMGEQLCVAYAHQYHIPTKIVRVFHTFSPCMTETDGRVFADFVYNVANDEDIVLTSDGSASRLFCYISDAIIAYLKVMLDGEVAEAYNVANEDGLITIRGLAELLVDIYPEKHLRVVYADESKKTNSTYLKSPLVIAVPDCSKIHKLGWKPEVSIAEGFRRVIESVTLDKS